MNFHLLCSNDKTKESLHYVRVDKTNIVATNAHILGVAPTNSVFSKAFIDDIESVFYIHKEDWQKMVNVSVTHLIWHDKQMIEIIIKGKRPKFVKIETDIVFPKWEDVIPHKNNPVEKIGINAEQAALLQKALCVDCLELVFDTPLSAIKVNTDKANVYGLVMPCKLQ